MFVFLCILVELQTDMLYWQQIITISVFAMSDIFLSLVAEQGLL